MNDLETIEGLGALLRDPTARVDEKDDAVMQMSDYDHERAIEILVEFARDETEDDMVLDSCGQSIATIMVRRGVFDKRVFGELKGITRDTFIYYVRGNKPEWELES